MTQEVEAVIAALKAVLADAQSRQFYQCKASVANRWVNQLPGAWRGKWRHLKVHSDLFGEIDHDDLIVEVQATIAYLEVNKEAIAQTSLWKRKRPASVPVTHAQPVDAEFSEVPRSGKKRKNSEVVALVPKK